MILIVSDKYDNSTSRVMEYLKYFNLQVLRINLDDNLKLIDGYISNKDVDFLFSLNGFEFRFHDVKFYWYRRGAFRPKICNKKRELEFLDKLIKDDLIGFEYFFNDLFIKRCSSLGDSRKNKLNKLTVLSDAVACGIDIPDTIITTKKESFIKRRVISKGIFDTTRFDYENSYYTGGTVEITKDIKDELLEDIPLTGVQERLDKEYEIRSFFLKGVFYNMIILSQSNPKTKEDFRNYDRERPNRTVPCTIPKELKENLSKLYRLHNIDTCSTDIVKTLDGRYVILDINPVGQFGMLSNPSNYLLEKEIALLMKKSINGQIN
jgi:hypothetical protein